MLSMQQAIFYALCQTALTRLAPLAPALFVPIISPAPLKAPAVHTNGAGELLRFECGVPPSLIGNCNYGCYWNGSRCGSSN